MRGTPTHRIAARPCATRSRLSLTRLATETYEDHDLPVNRCAPRVPVGELPDQFPCERLVLSADERHAVIRQDEEASLRHAFRNLMHQHIELPRASVDYAVHHRVQPRERRSPDRGVVRQRRVLRLVG